MADGNEALRNDGLTLEQIAVVLKVSKERVRQLEVRALRKARAWCERNGFKPEDLLRFDERLPGD